MVPLNAAVTQWTRDLTSGMNAFMPIADISNAENDSLRMVDLKNAFKAQ